MDDRHLLLRAFMEIIHACCFEISVRIPYFNSAKQSSFFFSFQNENDYGIME